MTFLKPVDEDYLSNLDELKEFMMSEEVTQEMFDDINKLKQWISDGTNCMWVVEKDRDGIHIIQYEWEDDFLIMERIIKKGV